MISDKAAAVLPCLRLLPALFQLLFGTCLEGFSLAEHLGKVQRRLASWCSCIKDREAFMSSHYNKAILCSF